MPSHISDKQLVQILDVVMTVLLTRTCSKQLINDVTMG